ncbi:MAG: M48 family metalloprotease, partial [Bacteroidota bacterium]
MNLRVNRKEIIYFGLKVCFTFVVLLLIISLFSQLSKALAASLVVFVTYFIMIVLFIVFQKMYLIAHLKGNGIEISEEQFPEIYEKYKEMGQKLSIKKLPKLFLIQQGGLLNAFAVRFSGNNYIAIYSDIFSLASSDIDSVIFILGHELGHVKRAHMS